MNFDSKENGGKKRIYCKTKVIKTVNPAEKNVFMGPNHKNIEIIMRIQVCSIRWMNFDSKENGGNKAFLAKLKYQNCVSR